MKRRYWTTAGLGGLLLLALSQWSCSGLVGSSKTSLTFWNGFTGPDGRVMLEMIREFNQKNPDIEVSMQRIPWALYYNKVMVSGLDGRGPHVFVVHSSALTRMNRAGILGDLSHLFTADLPKQDFDDYVLRQTEFDGKTVAVPLDIHPQGMYLNRKLLKNAGLVDRQGKAKVPTNRTEFLDFTKKMLDQSPNPDQYGFALTVWQNNFMSLIPQFGGRYLDEQGRADLNCPGNVQALEFLGSLRTKQKLIPAPDNQLGWIGYRQNKVAMVWDGIYMMGDLQRLEGFEYLGAPIPQIGPQPGTLADSHTLCIKPKLDSEQQQAAERFIAYLSQNSIRWAGAGQVPARKSVRQTKEFQKMQVQSAFASQIPNMMYMPRIPVLFEMGLEIQLAVEKVIRGRESAQKALDIADENTQKVLDRDAASQKSTTSQSVIGP